MSTAIVAHQSHAGEYGAQELKRAAHRYAFIALGISILIHLALLGAYYLSAILGGTTAAMVPEGPRVRIIDVELKPHIPGIYELPPVPKRPPAGPVVRKGIPVPVKDDPVVIENTIPTQEELAELVDPHGAELSPGALDSLTPTVPDDDVPPKGWRHIEKPPVVVRSVQPVYPALALRAGLEGRVIVRIWVDRHGKTRDVEILRSDNQIFDDAAVEAAKQFVFTPAYMNHGPVAVRVSVPFTFRILSRTQ
jgi:protein TonB